MRCRILLTKLTNKEQVTGYSKKGLLYLTNDAHFNPLLPFSRHDFTTEMPIKQQGMSISGYQPKLQLAIENQQFQSIQYQGSYILKPSPTDYPYLAENEHTTMCVMAKLGFDVPANGLVTFQREQ